MDCSDADQSILSFVRKAKSTQDLLLAVCNFTPVTRYQYRVGVPRGGFWQEILNSQALVYGGSGAGNCGGVHAAPIPHLDKMYSVELTLPPLGVILLKNSA